MLDWLYNIIGHVLVWIHSGLALVGLDPDSGWAWGLSIVLLTAIMRLLMVPLFVKQMNTQRKMQEVQPKIAKLRERYKHDKERLQRESMKLYQESGTNPSWAASRCCSRCRCSSPCSECCAVWPRARCSSASPRSWSTAPVRR